MMWYIMVFDHGKLLQVMVNHAKCWYMLVDPNDDKLLYIMINHDKTL